MRCALIFFFKFFIPHKYTKLLDKICKSFCPDTGLSEINVKLYNICATVMRFWMLDMNDVSQIIYFGSVLQMRKLKSDMPLYLLYSKLWAYVLDTWLHIFDFYSGCTKMFHHITFQRWNWLLWHYFSIRI